MVEEPQVLSVVEEFVLRQTLTSSNPVAPDRGTDRRSPNIDNWSRYAYQRDDLNDALAALWSAATVVCGTAKALGSTLRDENGLPMQIWA